MQWDAVIVNYNSSVFLHPCLQALSLVNLGPDRVIVVDNASTDDSLLELAGWPSAEVIKSSKNLGYAGGANLGVHTSSAPVVVVMNPDVELDPDFGNGLQNVFTREWRVGAAGAKLRYPHRNMIQHAGGEVIWPVFTTRHFGEGEVDRGQYDEPREVDYVTGAAIALRREALDAVEGFDEAFYPAYWEDVDLCWRLRRAGWWVRYQPELTGIHHEGGGASRDEQYFAIWMRNRLRMAAKHLTSDQWWREFVPAEIDRLRGEISAVEDADWPIRSGAEAIELLARSGRLSSTRFLTTLQGDRLVDSIHLIRELPDLADPRPRELTPNDGVLRRVKRFLSRFSGRLYAEEIYWQQRQFNESVVRAFEAQDRLNREMTAQLLLALLLIGRRQVANLSSDLLPRSFGTRRDEIV
jgi:O-antigen biosynthesis protein